MSYIEKVPGRKRWRLRWREGGRGTKKHTSEWFTSVGEVENFQRLVDARLAASKPLGKKLSVPLLEVIERWKKRQEDRNVPRSRRYVDETAEALRGLLADNKWVVSTDVARTSHLGIGNYRLIRALLRFARDHCDQPLLPKALLPPDTPRRRPKRPLLSPERIPVLVADAAEWEYDNGVIAHIVAVYGHRPQSLVQLKRGAVEVSFVGYTPADKAPTQGWLTLSVKGGDIIRHPLLPETVEALARLAVGLKPGAHLFTNHLGEQWKTGQAYSSWFSHCVGEGDGIYDLKRWAISWMHAGGMDVATIASITGHRTETINRYLVSNEAKQAAALGVMASGAPKVPPPVEAEDPPKEAS
jgi:integrase